LAQVLLVVFVDEEARVDVIGSLRTRSGRASQ
jgi:hypothetical protein